MTTAGLLFMLISVGAVATLFVKVPEHPPEQPRQPA